MQIDFNDIGASFFKYKEAIINLFVEYYGEEYRNLITNRLEKTYYNFSSAPNYDYNYMLKNRKQMRLKDIKLIRRKNKKYKFICNYIDKKIKNELLSFITERINFNTKNSNDFDKILSLFSSQDFEYSLIDCYSSQVNELLSNNCLQKSVEVNIFNDRRKIKEIFLKYGIDIEQTDQKVIDEIILFRDSLKSERLSYISSKLDFSLEIFNHFKNNYDFDLNDYTLADIAFIEDAASGVLSVNCKGKGELKFYQYIRVPITYLYSKGVIGYDVDLIHELIHNIETNGLVTGIKADKEMSILNEIRTQKLAIKLTQQLHAMNIFVFDDPNYFTTIGESFYENFFPLVDDFIENYEWILSQHAINNDFHGLIEIFSSSFKEFYDLLNKIYYDSTLYIPSNNKIKIKSDEQINELIRSMDEHYEKHGYKIKKYNR